MRILVTVMLLFSLHSCQQVERKAPKVPLTGFIESQGASLYYEIKGSGVDTLVFLHGTPSTMYAFLKDFDFLYRDFTIIFYDQRAGGRSSEILSPDSLTWQINVDDLESVRTYFRLQKMNILGVSWGSGLGTLYTSKYPDHVNRLILSPMKIRKTLVAPENVEMDTMITVVDKYLYDKR